MEECNHEYHAKVVANQEYERWYDGNGYQTVVLESQQIEIWCVSCGDIRLTAKQTKD